MTENMRSVIIRHKEALLTEEVKRRYNVDERRVLSAATLPELDEVYTRWGPNIEILLVGRLVWM